MYAFQISTLFVCFVAMIDGARHSLVDNQRSEVLGMMDRRDLVSDFSLKNKFRRSSLRGGSLVGDKYAPMKVAHEGGHGNLRVMTEVKQSGFINGPELSVQALDKAVQVEKEPGADATFKLPQPTPVITHTPADGDGPGVGKQFTTDTKGDIVSPADASVGRINALPPNTAGR